MTIATLRITTQACNRVSHGDCPTVSSHSRSNVRNWIESIVVFDLLSIKRICCFLFPPFTSPFHAHTEIRAKLIIFAEFILSKQWISCLFWMYRKSGILCNDFAELFYFVLTLSKSCWDCKQYWLMKPMRFTAISACSIEHKNNNIVRWHIHSR